MAANARTLRSDLAYIATLRMPVEGYDESDAIAKVGDAIHKEGTGLAELIEAVAGARMLMNWIHREAELPSYLRPAYEALYDQSVRMDRMVEAACEALGVGDES